MKTSYRGYFDYASATPLDPIAISAMAPYAQEFFYNPSALYKKARDIREVLETERQNVASVLGVKSREIIFTAGCTEANNLAIQGVLKAHPGGTILVSATEHDSVLSALKSLPGDTIPVLASGELDCEALRDLLNDNVVLVSVIYANNEIGTVQPLREIAIILEEVRKKRGPNGLPLYFHSDAAQAGNYLTMKARSLGVQLMSVNGGKIYGPKASGCLFVGSEVKIEPILFGGFQESGLRSGTENLSSIVGFSRSLMQSSSMAPLESKRLIKLRDKLVIACESLGGILRGSRSKRLPNNINISFPGVDNEVMVLGLDNLGFQVASGSACHAQSGESSHVLKAIGLSEDQARESIRITPGRYTDEADVDNLISALRRILAK